MEVIEKARKRAEELEAELKKLREFIAVYDALEGGADEIFSDSTAPQTEKGRKKTGSRPETIVRFAENWIKEIGEPMTRTELVEAAEHNGLTVGGSDKSKNMGTILWRSDRFYNIDGRGYWPKDAPPWDGNSLL